MAILQPLDFCHLSNGQLHYALRYSNGNACVTDFCFGFITFLANQVATGLAVGILSLGISALIGKNMKTHKCARYIFIPLLSEYPLLGPFSFSKTLLFMAQF